MDDQPDHELELIGTTPRRIVLGTLALVAATCFIANEVNLEAYPGGNLVVAFGVFLVLSRILPHQQCPARAMPQADHGCGRGALAGTSGPSREFRRADHQATLRVPADGHTQ